MRYHWLEAKRLEAKRVDPMAQFLRARRARKVRVRGPFVGGLWVCTGKGFGCTGMSPELAYRAWSDWNDCHKGV